MRLKKRFTLSLKNNLRFLPDRLYVKLYFYAKLGYIPNIDEPLTFTEKLQWMKLNYRDPRLTALVDKYEVRSFVEKTIGAQYLVPLIGVFDTVDDFLRADLPNEFVVKCTHDSQSTHVCVDKASFDFDTAAHELRTALGRNWYWQGREWAYKDVKPRILVEGYLKDRDRSTPNDYKFYCFDGVCKMVQCDADRFENNHRQQYFSPDWESYGDWHVSSVPESELLPKPEGFDEMLLLSQRLAAGFAHVRVDWYCIDGHPFFGELTFYTGGGFDPLHDKEDKRYDPLDRMLGDVFSLPPRYVSTVEAKEQPVSLSPKIGGIGDDDA